MATVTVKWTGNPPCGAGSTPYVGETYFLYLNQTFFSTDVTAAIEGTFVSEGPGGTGYDRTYTFTFDDTAIPSGFTALDSCHIKSVACVSSCCEELRKELDNWGTQVVASDATLSGDGTAASPLEVDLCKTLELQSSGQVGWDHPTVDRGIGAGKYLAQYVEVDGDDSNDGLSPLCAKRTLNAAWDALLDGDNAQENARGTVFVGQGVHEFTPIKIAGHFKVIGQGCDTGAGIGATYSGLGGTLLRLADNSNDHAFGAKHPDSQFAYDHGVQFKDLGIDGNSANNVGPYDVIQITGGGFNCELRNVEIRHAARWGIQVNQKMINMAMYDVTMRECGVVPAPGVAFDPTIHGGAIHFRLDQVSGSDTFLWSAGQIDKCGRYPVFVNHTKGDIGGTLIFDSIESEAFDTVGAHLAAIGYSSNTNVANDQFKRARQAIIVRGWSALNLTTDVTHVPEAFIHVIAGETEPDLCITSIRSSGTNILYKNTPLGFDVDNVSSDNFIAYYSNSGQIWGPTFKLSGPTYSNDAAAGAAGLQSGTMYKDGAGHIKYKL